jgi:hypothetical protein
MEAEGTAATVEDMRRFAGEAWGAFGVSVVSKWCEFNARYFDGALKPVPLVITDAQPFEGARAWTILSTLSRLCAPSPRGRNNRRCCLRQRGGEFFF